MSISETIASDLTAAVKARDEVRIAVLRMLKSELKYKQIELGRPLSDDDAIGVLSSAAKRRLEAIDSYKQGGRDDLAAKEQAELEIIKKYLPEQLTDQELDSLIEEAIKESGAIGPADLGKVMKLLMPKVKGKADGRKVNELVRSKLEK